MGPVAVDLRRVVVTAAALRLGMVVYGEWQDAHLEVRYTDLDYLVFSDAAALVVSGRSPFERSTYRYSPILAFLLAPNAVIHPSCGKLLFSAADLIVGVLVDTILKLRGVPESRRLWSVGAWLFNPFTFTIGTRGNCEPIVCLMVLWIIVCILNGVKCIRQQFVLCKGYSGPPYSIQQWSPTQNISNQNYKSSVWSSWSLMRSFITVDSLLFGLISGSIFFFCTALFFYLYGWDFLNEALLYHLTRTDPRHNFSIYFYHIYLRHQYGFSILERLVSFLPQLMVQLVLVIRFAQDLSFCLFLQTVSFVAFNKVITAQYFVWFFCLFPLILPWSDLRFKWKGLLCILVWMFSQLHWLFWGYLLEFKGLNVFLPLWVASLLFLAANTSVLILVMGHHRYTTLFIQSPVSDSDLDCSMKKKKN